LPTPLQFSGCAAVAVEPVGKGRSSPTMALRIEKAFGMSMDMLLRMQLDYASA
jgi:plasmid maintenance system antidote protein VapI